MTQKPLGLNILLLLIKRPLIWEICIYYLKFIKYLKNNNDVLGRPVIPKCDMPREKTSEFLNSHLKRIMQES